MVTVEVIIKVPQKNKKKIRTAVCTSYISTGYITKEIEVIGTLAHPSLSVLFTRSKTLNHYKLSSMDEQIKKSYIFIHNKVLFDHKDE